MKGLARTSFGNGAALRPAQTPYDFETLLEHLAFTVRRNGQTRLEVDVRSWVVTLAGADAAASSCSRCDKP